MKPLAIKEGKDSYNRTVYHIHKGEKSRYVYGSIEWDGRHRSWYFFDWGETRWSSQHMKEISDFMKKI